MPSYVLPMRILFTRFPLESIYGGAEVQTLSLMKGLRERGHEVAFLGSCPVLLREAASFHLSAFRLEIGAPPVTKWGVVSFLWRQSAMRQALSNVIEHRSDDSGVVAAGTDAVCMLTMSEKLLLTDWAVTHGIRVFWIEHDRVGRWLRWNPWLWKLRRLSRLATTVVVSDLSKRIYVELGWKPENIVVIPNGIDTERFQNTDSRFQKDSRTQIPDSECARASSSPTTYNLTPNTSLRVGTIARLSREKGVDLLIEAVKDLPNIHLTIVGTGRDEGKIRNLIRTLHLEQRATIQQTTPAPEQSSVRGTASNVGDFYRSLDIFVLPSRDHDPCPLAPIEAMACGIPVVLTEACGTAGYLKNEIDALVVPANNPGALREAILRIQRDGPLRSRLAARGPQVVAERFSMERMVDEYEEVLGRG